MIEVEHVSTEILYGEKMFQVEHVSTVNLYCYHMFQVEHVAPVNLSFGRGSRSNTLSISRYLLIGTHD